MPRGVCETWVEREGKDAVLNAHRLRNYSPKGFVGYKMFAWVQGQIGHSSIGNPLRAIKYRESPS